MRTKIGLFVVATALVLTACVTKNPSFSPGNTNGGPAYIPDPRIEQAHQAANDVAKSVAPVNPYAGITNYAIDAGFGLAAIIASLIAKKKNDTVNTMAAGVQQAGAAATVAVLNHASDTPHFSAIAAALNDQAAAGASPGH